MNPEFEIAYTIDDAEWTRAASARWNAESEPLYDCFYGDVRVSVGGTALFGEEPFHLSVADLACGLAIVLQRDLPLIGGDAVATFHQSDDALEIRFERRGALVRVTTNVSRGNQGEVPADAFFDGVNDFLRRFTSEASARVPQLLDWKELDSLRRYAAT
jgi:hypothetical protein